MCHLYRDRQTQRDREMLPQEQILNLIALDQILNTWSSILAQIMGN